MGLFTRLVTGSGIAAFFFSWIIQMLWNSLIAGHLGLLPRLSYLQAAGLWLLFTLFTAWSGIGVGSRVLFNWKGQTPWKGVGRRVWSRVRSRIRSVIRGEPDVEWQGPDTARIDRGEPRDD